MSAKRKAASGDGAGDNVAAEGDAAAGRRTQKRRLDGDGNNGGGNGDDNGSGSISDAGGNGYAECPYEVILVDIEGTTTSISFVKDTLFPYVSDSIDAHLKTNWESEECKADVSALCAAAAADVDGGDACNAGKALAAAHVTDDDNDVDESGDKNVGGVANDADSDTNASAKRDVVAAYVRSLVAADRKVTALKTLQGHMWRKGYENGKLRAHIYTDVAAMLRAWARTRVAAPPPADGGDNSGGGGGGGGADVETSKWTPTKDEAKFVRLCVYSSGSVEAQKLLFAHSVAGDLLPLFSGEIT
jgi:methionine salvage enolase-phosphatase E1